MFHLSADRGNLLTFVEGKAGQARRQLAEEPLSSRYLSGAFVLELPSEDVRQESAIPEQADAASVVRGPRSLLGSGSSGLKNRDL